MPIINDAFEP